MTLIQKQAWFVLFASLLAILAAAAIYIFTGSFARSVAGMGLLGLTGFTPWMGIGRRRRGEVLTDERDRAILHSAARIAFGAFWLAAVGAAVALLVWRGESATLHVSAVVTAVWFAWLLLAVVHASSVVWMSRGGRGE